MMNLAQIILDVGEEVWKAYNFNPERKTLLKFTFTEDALISWKEDKLTLSMAMTNRSKINPIGINGRNTSYSST